MYVIGVQSSFKFLLSVTEDIYVDNDWDISMEEPDGLYTHTNDIVSYVNPTDTTTGEVNFDFIPSKEGVHKMKLSKGTASSHLIISELLFSVVAPSLDTEIPVPL